MSMLAKYIVGRITLPRLKHWSSVLLPLPVILQQICHHDLKVLATVPVISSRSQVLSLFPEEEQDMMRTIST